MRWGVNEESLLYSAEDGKLWQPAALVNSVTISFRALPSLTTYVFIFNIISKAL